MVFWHIRTPKHRNLRDGLSLIFAAAEQGNSKAAKRAREAAYTEQESPKAFDNLLLNASDKQPAFQSVKYSSFYNDYLEKKEPSQDNSKSWNKIDINDHSAIQETFNKVRKPGATADDLGQPGDFDGSGELQCPDVPKWFLSKYTTLSPVSGNGKDQVGNLANTYGLEVSTTPCAPAVFSVAPDSYGPGVKIGGKSDPNWGHTGIILSCEKIDDDHYKLTYLHTYNSLLNDGKTSAITERVFSTEELKNTTFLDIKKYLK